MRFVCFVMLFLACFLQDAIKLPWPGVRFFSFDLSDVGMSVASAGSSLGAAAFPPPRMKDYVLMEALGSGTYATVYKAVHKVQKA